MQSLDVLNCLADASVRALCLAAVAMLAIAVTRTRSAPVKHAVWTVVVCAMLALPLLSLALPPIPLRVLEPTPPVIEPLPEAVSEAPVAASRATAPIPQPRRSSPVWPAVAVSVYVLGAAFLFGKLALGYFLSRRLVKRSTPVDSPPVEISGAALGESKAVSVPLTIGWRRPHILLPAGWRAWDRAKLEAVLAHEAAHVARRDWLISLLARVNTSIFWFHPLAWWMERKLAALAEDACDEAPLRANCDRELYAQVLLEMAQAVRTADGRLAWNAVGMARPSQVRRRVEAILDDSRRLSRGMTKARWAAVLLCAVPLAYGAAAVQFEQAPVPVQIGTKSPWAPGSFMDSVSRGNKLTPEEAQRLEAHVQANPEDLAARSSLIVYYTLNGVREPRLRHIFWFIENHPESEFAGYHATGIYPFRNQLNSESDYARARDLWLEQVRRHENDLRVLRNAAKFLAQSGGDLATAADLLKRVAASGPNREATNALAMLYARAIVGALRPSTLRTPDFPYEPALAAQFQSELETSTDAVLLMNTALALRSLVLQGRNAAELAPASELAERLQDRGTQYLRPAPESRTQASNREAAPFPPPPNGRPPEVLERVPPDYPPLAKQVRIQGTVRFRVQVGADGTVKNMQLIAGHPLLVQAAQEALRRWKFRPAEANGQPVEGSMTVDLNFTLPPGEAPASQTAAEQTRPVPRIRVGGNVQMAQLVKRVDPVYPPLARQEGIQGTVQFTVTIGPDGLVKDIQLESGHPLLVPAAQEAVRQWEWRPTLLNGQAVEVITTVAVQFTLPEAQ